MTVISRRCASHGHREVHLGHRQAQHVRVVDRPFLAAPHMQLGESRDGQINSRVCHRAPTPSDGFRWTQRVKKFDEGLGCRHAGIG